MAASLISPVEGTDYLSHQLRKGISLVSFPGHLGAAMSRHWSSRLNSDPDSLDYSSFSQGIDSIFSLTARLFLEDCTVGQTVLHARTPHLILTSALYLLTCLNEGPFTPWHSHSSKWCDVWMWAAQLYHGALGTNFVFSKFRGCLVSGVVKIICHINVNMFI